MSLCVQSLSERYLGRTGKVRHHGPIAPIVWNPFTIYTELSWGDPDNTSALGFLAGENVVTVFDVSTFEPGIKYRLTEHELKTVSKHIWAIVVICGFP